jgi:hypothetical protein
MPGRNCSPCARASSSEIERSLPSPDWEIALSNSPSAAGDVISALTDMPPADCPKIVTLSGSPPNSAMLSRIHSRAATWSSSPKFATSPSRPGWAKKPNRPSR